MTQACAQFRSDFWRPTIWRAGLIAFTLALAACGGGGGGGGGGDTTPPPVVPPPVEPPPVEPPPVEPPPVTGDDARRAVLKDIGEEIILPALRDFDTKAAALKAATDTLAATPGNAGALAGAKAAWEEAMTSWQRSEVLQVGPAGPSSGIDPVIGGQDFRNLIYSWPVTLDVCGVEAAADNGDPVDGNTTINLTGLAALEHLLFTSAPPASCPAQPDTQERAVHLRKLADRLAILATSLRNRWEPAAGNFIAQWSTAGLSGSLYSRPQDALNALSVALFYGEKISKDRKVAYPAKLQAAGLFCGNPVRCPEFLESPLSSHSGANLVANMQTFRDVFTGVNDKLGMNDLLEGIERDDLAQEITTELDAVLTQLAAIENDQGFDAAVIGITDNTECVNASANSSGLPPCALHGFMTTAMTTFRGPIVAALSLAIPNSAAGDND